MRSLNEKPQGAATPQGSEIKSPVGETTDMNNISHNRYISPLPFVSEANGKRCNWSVQASGNYQHDYEQGVSFAKRLLLAIRKKLVTPFFLELVVNDMPEEKGAMEHGFFSATALSATGGAA